MVVQRNGAGRAGAMVTALVVGGVLATAAGCGVDSAESASGAPADPAAAVRAAADRLAAAGGSRVTTSMEMATGAPV